MANLTKEFALLPKEVQALLVPTEAPEFLNLKEGDHIVKMMEARRTDSRHNADGTEKSDLPDYVDATLQIFYRVVSVEGKGSYVGRLNLTSYKKFETDLTEEEKESGKYKNVNGYACVETKDGLVRIHSEAGQARAQNILNGLAYAVGKDGQGKQIPQVIDEMIEEGIVFGIKLVDEEYNGKTYTNVASYFPVKAAVPIDGDAEFGE